MNFIEALSKCGGSTERIRSPIAEMKNKTAQERVKIYRPEWCKVKYPAQFVWVTSQNIPMVSIGGEQSMPLLLEVADLLANDWEVLQ